jgi:hypothetical protein
MTSIIPPKALALLAADVALLEQGTAEESRDLSVYRNDPVGFIRDVLRESPWSKQIEIANAVRDNYRVALRTCNSAGKTFLLAALSLWWIFARGGTVLATSAAYRSIIGQYVQGELRRQFARGGFPKSAELRESYIKVGGEFKLVAMVSSEADRLQGWHDPAGVLAILDESSGVPRLALNALESCLEDPARDRIISAGNPLNLDGFFPALFRPGSGWIPFHISAYMCPAYTGEGAPPRVGKSPAWVAEQKRTHGARDAEFVARVLGEFPDSLAANALVERAAVEWAQRNHADGNQRQAVAELPLRITVDPEHAWDRTAVALSQGAYVHEVRVLPFSGGNTVAITSKLVELVQEIEGRARQDPTDQLAQGWRRDGSFLIDVTGVGRGIADMLAAKGYPVVDYQSGAPAVDRARFGNARAESHWHLRELLQAHTAALPPNEELTVELLAIKYEIKNTGKTYMEPKDLIRDRIGRSPDSADVVAMALGSLQETASIGGSSESVYFGF